MPLNFDWIDPGNAGGSVIVPERPAWRPTLIWHICPYCQAKSDSRDALERHIGTVHPIERPTILLRGSHMPATLRVRRQISPDEVVLLKCGRAEIFVDGSMNKAITLANLPSFLQAQTSAHLRLRLFSDSRRAPFPTDYVLDISVPDETELTGTEDCFFRYLARDDVGLREVDDYAHACARFTSCTDYVSALGDFVLGVLAKDQSGNISLGTRDYVDKFQQALEGLREFDRSLARVLMLFMRINLNDFASPGLTSGVAALDRMFSFFCARAGLAINELGGKDSASQKPVEITKRVCPIDQVSNTLLKAVTRLYDHAPKTGIISELESIVERGSIAEADRDKARVILAEIWLRAAETQRAVRQLSVLSNNAVFGAWAIEQQAKRIP